MKFYKVKVIEDYVEVSFSSFDEKENDIYYAYLFYQEKFVTALRTVAGNERKSHVPTQEEVQRAWRCARLHAVTQRDDKLYWFKKTRLIHKAKIKGELFYITPISDGDECLILIHGTNVTKQLQIMLGIDTDWDEMTMTSTELNELGTKLGINTQLLDTKIETEIGHLYVTRCHPWYIGDKIAVQTYHPFLRGKKIDYNFTPTGEFIDTAKPGGSVSEDVVSKIFSIGMKMYEDEKKNLL
jgi:hypothetical protein